MKKAVITAVALTLALCLAVGGTLAYLTAKTGEVKNTFTVGDVSIDLFEHKYLVETNQLDQAVEVRDTTTNNNYKMVPGKVLPKDPKVVVKANSEACYVFVKVVKSGNFDTFMTSAMAEGWKPVEGQSGVYYREVDANTADQPFAVLADNQVTVNTSVTKAMMTASDFTKPTIAFTAYAVQQLGFATPAAAWVEAQNAQ